MKSHPFSDSDDSDENVDRSSPRSASQRFTKSGARDFKATPARKKHDVESNLKLNLNRMHEDEGDSLEDSDDDTMTKTARSTSSGTTSQLTPKPRERSFMKQDQTRPTTKPRHIDINDNDRNVFGQTTLKPSPRRTFTTLREDEEENQSFIAGFAHGTKRQSPTDIFSTSKKPDSRRGSQHYPSGREEDELTDSNDERHSHRHTKPNDARHTRQSSIPNDQSQSRRSSHRSRDESDLSDNDHHSDDRADLSRPRHSTHDVAQVITNPGTCSILSFPFRSLVTMPSWLQPHTDHQPVDLVQAARLTLHLSDVHLSATNQTPSFPPHRIHNLSPVRHPLNPRPHGIRRNQRSIISLPPISQRTTIRLHRTTKHSLLLFDHQHHHRQLFRWQRWNFLLGRNQVPFPGPPRVAPVINAKRNPKCHLATGKSRHVLIVAERLSQPSICKNPSSENFRKS